ncbi:hypothetical protein GWI33_003105 [Rhynchophorus ferrugineus]|uniref:Ribosome production factor 2 homolog n=1 Tax=Rhynchophorus ferrugineus TaxID=354439 RepID=A0A834MH88_RHYFE|nr:hypothetical protein GWI33_003105 [Rhynchophorus ferrugineus]
MSVLQRVVKPTTRKGKKILLKKEPQVIEGPKKAIFLKGRKTSDKVRYVLNDMYDLKKPEGQKLSKRNDITVFEDATKVEFLCKKYDSSLFVMGSHSKKRPDNLVIGRMFNNELLDMIELHVEEYEGLKNFVASKVMLGVKPCLLFNGPLWEESEELKHLKSIFIDFFHKETVNAIRLQGIEHSINFNATPDGPRIDFTLRRTKLPTEDLMKEACTQPKELKLTKKKNISTDELGTTHGRIHVGKQNINSIQTRKMKGLKKTVEEKKIEKATKRKALAENNELVKKKRV